MATTATRRLAYATLAVLYLLHNDLWFWYDGDRFLGLPIGLTYHLLFAGAVVLTMAWLVRSAWPVAELDRLATGSGSAQAANGGEREARAPEAKG
ncbi:MAG: hypothetical protein J4F98_02910 [Acidobacteria bacterium]|nr:hypothetical protein [Acidobacteriota bacterium]